MRFAIFPVHLSKVLRLPRKIDARSYEVLRLSRKIILANLHIWYSKMQPLSGNERPDLLTSLMNMSLVLRLPRKCIFADPLQMSHACHHSWKCYKTLTFLVTFDKVHNPLRLPRETTSEPPKVARTCGVFVHFDFEMCFAPQRRALFRHLNCQKWSEHGVLVHFDLEMCFVPQRRALFQHLNFQKWSDNGVFCTFWLGNVLRATTACTFSTSQVPKVVRTPSAFNILTWKRALRHNGVHFFNISTSKSGPNVVCFVHFDLEMCFVPQRRALFQHLNFQKWSDNGVFWCVLYILTSKCASRHNGVQFFISPLARWLRARRFSEPTFRPSGATNHWKNTVNRDFPTFSRVSIFFLLTLSLLLFSLLIFLFSLPLPCSAFHLSILSEVWLLNFLRSHIAT